MNGTFNLALAGYFTALLFATADLLTAGRRKAGLIATALLGAGLVAQTAYIVVRWFEAGRAPFSNMFESMVLFAWAIVGVYLCMERHLKIPVMRWGAALLGVGVLAYSSTFNTTIEPLVPALRSNWLTVHVLTCFLGYGSVALAFLASVAYLVSRKLNKSALLPALETMTEKTISFGFLFLTLGIISGAIWANSAWGTYWSWDPKETWSLITWFIYAIYLHCRYMRGWKGTRAAWISTVGFASVLFTYFGVNYILSGLHSYAS